MRDKLRGLLGIGSNLPPTDTIESQLAQIRQALQNSVDVAVMADTIGWKKIRSVLLDRVDGLTNDILQLSKNPDKYGSELQYLSAVREVYSGLVDLVETTRAARADLEKQHEHTLNTARVNGLL